MLQATLIGRLGGDAEVKVSESYKFVTFRVAHSSRWKDATGVEHEETMWVDVTLDGQPPVTQYLKKGTQIYVQGYLSTRVYSSPKDKCMKAGVTIKAKTIELLGGQPDLVPSELIDPNTGRAVNVLKVYSVPELRRGEQTPEYLPYVSKNGKRFVIDRDGSVAPFEGTD